MRAIVAEYYPIVSAYSPLSFESVLKGNTKAFFRPIMEIFTRNEMYAHTDVILDYEELMKIAKRFDTEKYTEGVMKETPVLYVQLNWMGTFTIDLDRSPEFKAEHKGEFGEFVYTFERDGTKNIIHLYTNVK